MTSPGESAGSARPRVGDALELEIDSLAFGGEGIGRVGEQGYVVFVADAIPGDRVRAVVSRRKRSYAHARTVEVLRPSPERIPPRAAHPGAAWQVLPYERQLEIKQGQVEEVLRRIGGLDGYELEPIVPALEQWRYRNKLEYSFGVGPEGLVCGFHAPSGANQVVQIEDCLLGSERNNLARNVALRWCREQGLTAWARSRSRANARSETTTTAARTTPARAGRPAPARAGTSSPARAGMTAPAPDRYGRALLRNLVVREGRRTGLIQVRLVTTEGELQADAFADVLADALGDHLSGVLWTRSSRVSETTSGGATELLRGRTELPERVGELDLRISPEAFFQTNTEMTEVLYGLITQYASLQGWERVFDLYCGIGTIGLTLAPRAGELWGLELVEDAVANAITAARRNEIQGTHFFAGDVRRSLPELLARAGRPDVIVLDPPRAGLSQKVIHRLIDAAPKRIVYVSCNPSTLAPNAAALVEAGWTLVKVRPVDMFPQTPHIECVALLERTSGAPGRA